jgi:hypothetical protein
MFLMGGTAQIPLPARPTTNNHPLYVAKKELIR